MEPPYHDSYLDSLYPDSGFLGGNTNVVSQMSPIDNSNNVAHLSSNLARNDAPNSSTDESPTALLGLLKQQVQLMIGYGKQIEEMKRSLLSSQEESRRKDEKFTKALEELGQHIKRLQDHVKKHGLEPPPRSRPHPYRLERPERPRMPFLTQNSDPYGSFPPHPPHSQEQLWNNEYY